MFIVGFIIGLIVGAVAMIAIVAQMNSDDKGR